MKEKLFASADDIGLVLPRPGPGYLTAAPPTLGTDPVMHAGGRQRAATTLWWAPCAPETVVERAQEASARTAVELCPYGCGGGNAGLGLALAEHLAQHRGPGAVVGPCCLTRPAVPPALVCLPHLVRADTSPGHEDLPVWEILPAADADTWLGRPVPRADLAFFEQHLTHLLAVKRNSRTSGTPRCTPAQQKLRRLLEDEGRYVSIRLVLQHAALFRTLIAESIR